MLPDYREVNPYQRKLQAGLEANGMTVAVSDTIGHFAILGAVQKEGLPDVVHLHWLHSFMISKNPIKSATGIFRLLCELLILKSKGVTIVWTVHNVLEHRKRSPRLEKLIKHLVVRLSDRVIVHCSAARETIVQAYRLPQKAAHKCRVIPHGHYIDSYPNDQTQAEARTALGGEFDDSQIVYLYFGQIRPYKNIPTLIKNFKKIDEPNVRLMIVGNPWDEDEAERVHDLSKSDDRIHTVFEFVPDDEIQLYMNAADVVVLPFEEVLTSGSALLAMSFGKALIAPRIGCVDELLDPDGGFAYKPKTEGGLLRAIEQASNADLEAMGTYNYRKANQFDWGMIARRTCSVYSQE